MSTAPDCWPDALFDPPADDLLAPTLRLVHGTAVQLHVGRWHGRILPEDLDALTRTVGPVLDIGCGPGRHVHTLMELGCDALGIDVSPSAVRAARRRGARAIVASVWDAVPACGYWETALLLDGNIGIGGDPEALLRRVAELLGGPRRIIIELSDEAVPSATVNGPGAEGADRLARVEHDGRCGPWFPWAVVTVATVRTLARKLPFVIDELWQAEGRSFACISMPRPMSGGAEHFGHPAGTGR